MMVHRCECLLFTSQLCLPYLAFCFDPSECFQDLCIWSRAMGNKSSTSANLEGCLSCVTHHTHHASVTDFRPISGNIVEVTLMTPPIMYINSHAKETYFP